MTKRRILELIPLLPNDVPYVRDIPHSPEMGARTPRMAFVEKWHRCLSDPAFGWHFVQSFVETKHTYPIGAVDSSLLFTYWWLTQEQYFGASVGQAIRLALPDNGTQAVVQAMLLIPTLKLQEICHMMNISLAALRIYMDLFFNVRDRMNEPDYIRQQVYPETRRVLLREDDLEVQSDTFLLRRIAYEHGYDALEYLAGFRSNYLNNLSAAQARETFENDVLAKANFVMAMGGTNSSARVLQLARSLVAAAKTSGSVEASTADPFGLAAMSVDCAILENVRRLNAPDPLIALQKKYDQEDAAKVAKN